MKKAILAMALMVGVAATGSAAPETWTGKISDEHCGAKHQQMEGKKMSDRECTEVCVKGGAKYVFVAKDKVYQIADQKDAALATHAGHTVLLTGEMKGDTITVSKIEMPKPAEKK
jgi:cellobiose phosphorylase